MAKELELNYGLLEQRKWREFLKAIPKDRKQFDLTFSDLNSLKSFKATAYELNSDKIMPYTIALSINKDELKVTVTIIARNETT